MSEENTYSFEEKIKIISDNQKKNKEFIQDPADFSFSVSAERNIYVFFNTYAVLDMPNLKDYKLDINKLEKSDKWLLARLNKLFLTYL